MSPQTYKPSISSELHYWHSQVSKATQRGNHRPPISMMQTTTRGQKHVVSPKRQKMGVSLDQPNQQVCMCMGLSVRKCVPRFVYDSQVCACSFTLCKLPLCLQVAGLHYTTSATCTTNVTSLFLVWKVGKAATHR